MNTTLKNQYAALHVFWDEALGAEVWRSAIAFGILMLAGFAVGQFNPTFTAKVFSLIESYFGQLNLEGSSGVSALMLFSNNVHACFLSVLYGAIPFLYLSALSLGMNSMLLGIMAVYIHSRGYSYLYYAAGILPHGILEIPALIVAFALGLYLCGQTSRHFRRQATVPFQTALLNICRAFLLIILPLLAAAAVIEIYITPVIAGLFL